MSIKLPLPYLSYSAYWLYNKDPLGYYQQYFIARVEEPTEKMLLGKIFQEAWSDPAFDYEAELIKEGFTSNYARIVKTAIDHPQAVRLPKVLCEKKFQVQGRGLKYPILGIFDGFDKNMKLVVENKMGTPWRQDRVDTDEQLTWYTLICVIKFGFYPKIRLQSFNGRNGIPTIYNTKRSKAQVEALIRKINAVVERISAGDFELR